GDKRWGHVGIVVAVAPAIVVHADTGTGAPAHPAPAPGETVGEVRAVPLADFLGDVDHAGVFRLSLSPEARTRMIAWADEAAATHTPFDRGYSLESANNLYCTELVWRALSQGLGHDALPEKSHRLGRTYVALSDLSLHPLAQEVLEVDWAHRAE
uniref:YiiX/YebB-like N1pC/P60 family cysteine hydrolase n=1 Tax=Henriciella aquimarina TaxID=545261 RepID=UPI001F460F08